MFSRVRSWLTQPHNPPLQVGSAALTNTGYPTTGTITTPENFSYQLVSLPQQPRGHRAAEMAALADRWPINWAPEYREPTCAGCGRIVRRMWHVWFEAGGYKKEIHLCRRCGRRHGLT